MATPSPIERTAGQSALERGAWSEARALFEQELRHQEAPEAAEGLSWAAWWLEDVEACLAARERAYHAYRRADDRRGAARMALWLGDDYTSFLGAHAVADGWFGLATRELAQIGSCPELGWLTVFDAHAELGRGEVDIALRLAGEAREYGRAFGAVDLEMFGLATEGVARIARGEAPAGFRALDAAAAAAVAGTYENLVPAAWTCCLVMAACEELRDFDRAIQWCRQIARFSQAMNVRFVRGVCRAHYAAIHTWRADWETAESALTEALQDLTVHRPWYHAEGIVRLGQLRYRQGRMEEAETLFEQSGQHPLALQGMGALHFEQGDLNTARDLLERSLRLTPSETAAIRAGALEVLVRVEIELGDLEAATGWIAQLQIIADQTGTEGLRGSLAISSAHLATAQDELDRACDLYEDAIDAFTRCSAPVEIAAARMGLANTLMAMGRFDAAAREARLALDAYQKAGARSGIERTGGFIKRMETACQKQESAAVLTDRQCEVLRLVAAGYSDQEIANALFLSPHTVHRHVANVFNRLGCSSRAAAVAEAGRLELL